MVENKHTDYLMALSEGELLCFKCLWVGPRTRIFNSVHHVMRVTVVLFGLV